MDGRIKKGSMTSLAFVLLLRREKEMNIKATN